MNTPDPLRWNTKRMRGEPVLYEETKSTRIEIRLTPTARDVLDQRIRLLGCSRSEYIERHLRGTLNETNHHHLTS